MKFPTLLRWVTAEGLSPHEMRRRGVLLTAGVSAATRVFQFAINLIMIRLTVNYLGPERFGLWAALTTFTLLLGFADLGIGSGLLNGITSARANNDRRQEQELLVNGLAMLSAVGLVLAGGFLLSYPHVSWATLFKVHSPVAQSEAGISLAVVLLCFACILPLSVAQKYNLALQKGFANNVWMMAGAVMSLLGVAFGIHQKASLPWLLVAFSGGQLAGAILTWLQSFGVGITLKLLRPSLISRKQIGSLGKVGLRFFIVQGTTSIMMQLPPFLITFLLGAAAVGPYVVANRIAMVAPMALSLGVQPLWPAYADALARGEIEWIRRVFWKSLKGTLALTLILGALFQWKGAVLIRAWIGASEVPGHLMLLGVGLFAAGNCLHWVSSMCLSGCGRTTGQLLIQVPAGVISVAGAFYLSPVFGAAGIALAFGVAEVLLGFGQCIEIAVFLSAKAAPPVLQEAEA